MKKIILVLFILLFSDFVIADESCNNEINVLNTAEYTLSFNPPIKSDHNSGIRGFLEDLRNKKIDFFGKRYTIVMAAHTAQNNIKLVFMEGVSSDLIDEGETKLYTVNAKSYLVTASYISSTKVKLKVNDELTSELGENELYKLKDGTEVGIIDILGQNLAGEVDRVEFVIGVSRLDILDTNTALQNSGAIILIDSLKSLIKGDIIVSLDQGVLSGNDVALSKIILKYDRSEGEESNFIISEMAKTNFSLGSIVFLNEYGSSVGEQILVRTCELSEKIAEVVEPIPTKCGGKIVNMSTDNVNCGKCFNQCSDTKKCISGICSFYCGNSICDSNENCGTCSKDCKCPSNTKCKENTCSTEYCGNGVCDSDENCGICAKDCICLGDYSCVNSECTIICSSNNNCLDNNPCTIDTCAGQPKDCLHERQNGCIVNESCLSYGAREGINFCNINNVMLKQKSLNDFCNSNYECSTNICQEHQCAEKIVYSVIVINWFKGLFDWI